VQSLLELKAYVAAEIEEQRGEPNGGLIYALLTAGVDGQHLSDEEVLANTIILLIGGHETTTSLSAGVFLRLLHRRAAYERLRNHPEIIATAVEELVRFESPSQNTARVAASDKQLRGKTIKKVACVVVGLAAANRDPDRFPDPDYLDLVRTDNRHVAFDGASHFCFGAPLARMEGQIAFRKLLSRSSKLKLVDEKLEWRSNGGFRSLTSLNISFEPECSGVSA
jgi:cytochrome P450